MTKPVYVVARALSLRAVMTSRHGSGRAKVESPVVTLHLTRPRPPRAILRTTPVVSARLDPRFRAYGSLLYLSADHCYPGNAPYDYLGAYWSTAPAHLITAQCNQPTSWRVIAGWIGRSVANIHYVAGPRRHAALRPVLRSDQKLRNR
jgi:hypothetical protein